MLLLVFAHGVQYGRLCGGRINRKSVRWCETMDEAFKKCLHNMQTSGTIKILQTDTKFYDSPDAGDPACLCSRCGEAIEEAPIRAFPESGEYEYRYHPACLGATAP